MVEWVCLKCGYKWTVESGPDPRYCPKCGEPTIYVPRKK